MASAAQTGWESFSPGVQTLLVAMLQETKMCRKLQSVQSSALQRTVKKLDEAFLSKNTTGQDRQQDRQQDRLLRFIHDSENLSL